MTTGNVVHFVGKRRRYVIVGVNEHGKFAYMSALSGGRMGCGPSNISPEQVEMDKDQRILFTGVESYYLYRMYAEACNMVKSWGYEVFPAMGNIQA